jgi:hypothetical protein
VPEVSSQLLRYVDDLAASESWSYRASTETASEPAAWTAIALAAYGRSEAAVRPARWLASLQQPSGAVGVSAKEPEPCWPTSLAILAWKTVASAAGGEFDKSFRIARNWSLASAGKTAPRSTHVGHDTELVGWSWAAETHSWLEPTCMFVMGLRAAGDGDHPRVREGVKLIVDRLLPQGGANYGNTIVLGQPLVPHVQPTGLAMLALCGESADDVRVDKSLDYLAGRIDARTSAPSLAMACLGLAAHGQRPAACEEWIARSLEEPRRRPLAALEKSLLLLAAAPIERLAELGLAPREIA